jgi:hypothetical protein
MSLIFLRIRNPRMLRMEKITKESTVSGGNLLRFWENLEIFHGNWASTKYIENGT